ncbi:hypothetical protein O5282_26925 [Escherichia coli]|nr:hypothetical protein [Escherichia coli]
MERSGSGDHYHRWMSDAVLPTGINPCEVMWGRSVKAWAVTDIVGFLHFA